MNKKEKKLSEKHKKNSTSNYISNYSYDENTSDIDSFISYLNEKMMLYEESINSSYLHIKSVITKLEEEFPQVDINCFSDFYLICEEYYNSIQIFKQGLQRLNEVHNDNEKLKSKTERLKIKKVTLKNLNENYIEDNKFKADQINNLEEQILNMTKDYLELNQKINKNDSYQSYANLNSQENSNSHNDIPNYTNYLNEIKIINEEKSNLQRENLILSKSLEKTEQDIRCKYIIKSESEKIIMKIEAEKNGYYLKLKISDNNLEKIRRELQSFKFGNDELKKELKKSEKKIEILTLSNRNRNSGFGMYTNSNYSEAGENKGTPLNFILNDEDDEEKNIVKENKILRKTFSKLKIDSAKDVNRDRDNDENINNNEVSDFQIEPNCNNLNSKNKLYKNTENISKVNLTKYKIQNSNIAIHELNEVTEQDENNINKSSVENENTLFQFQDFHKEEFNNQSRSSIDNADNINMNSNYKIMNYKNKNNFELKLTSNEIVNRMSQNRMSQNDFIHIRQNKNKDLQLKNENVNAVNQIKKIENKNKFLPNNKNDNLVVVGNEKIINNNLSLNNINIKVNINPNNNSNSNSIEKKEMHSKLISIKKNADNYNEDIYKEFFLLTYQSLKLNSDNIEPFLYLNGERLYKWSTDNCVPFHKFDQFIKEEIKKYDDKINARNNYNKSKFESVLSFISSRLF